MSERVIKVMSPEYNNNVRDFEELIKNTYRKYKLRNYGMKIKFDINKSDRKPKIVLLSGNKEIKTYNDISVETLDEIINHLRELFAAEQLNKKQNNKYHDSYMRNKTKYMNLLALIDTNKKKGEDY